MPTPVKITQEYLNDKAGTVGLSKRMALNVLAGGTTAMTSQDAANSYAGTIGLSIQDALNAKVGMTGLSTQEAASLL